MEILVIVLAVIVGALAVGLFLQMKAAKKQTEDQQQLLKDYEKQQRLLEDYDSLSKNFDSIGKGYEQALLLFDKMADIRHNLELIAQNDKDPDSVERINALLKKFDNLQG